MVGCTKLKTLEGVISRYCNSSAIVSERQVTIENPLFLGKSGPKTLDVLTIRLGGSILNVYVHNNARLVITLDDLNRAKFTNSLDILKAISDITGKDLSVVSLDGSKHYYETSPCNLNDYDKYYKRQAN